MLLSKLRNIGISAHIDAGKTTLAERMLYYCGRIHTMREVHGKDGGATMDSTQIEKDRGITIESAVTRIEWRDGTINLVDTPGHVDFTVEVERSLRVLDGAVLVLCSAGGVQSQTRTVERQMQRYGVPRIALINKMDLAGANPQRVLAQLREKLKVSAIPVQLPIGCGADFEAVVDLIEMQAVYFEGDHGKIVRRTEVPDAFRAEATAARENLLQELAMIDERILEAVTGGIDVPNEEIRTALRRATLAREVVPVLYGSAIKNLGVQEVLDAIQYYLPDPSERIVYANQLDDQEDHERRRVQLRTDVDAPVVAMAFKTVVGSFGQLTYVRLYQGQIEKGAKLRNARTRQTVRFGRLVRIHAGATTDIPAARAGDIVGVLGVDCATGDTFLGEGLNCALENIHVAEPVMSLSVAALSRDDAPKLAKALEKFRREDPTFQVASDPRTGQTLISGMGRLHLEVYLERLNTELNCPCRVGLPEVAYKESPLVSVDFDYKYRKQTGGPGRVGHIVGRMTPLPEDAETTFVFENQITGGSIPKEYVPSIERGFREQLAQGPLGEFEVVGLRIELQDGSYHEQDSSDAAFRLCARQAMREDILPRAQMVLLEPIMKAEIEFPGPFQGAVSGWLSQSRGVIKGSETQDGDVVIEAEIPLAETLDLADHLRTITQGNAAFSLEFLTYRRTPAEVQDRVLAKRKAG